MGFDRDLPPNDEALEQLLRDARFGPPPPGDTTPWDFARRWSKADRQQRVWPVVSRLLADEDEVVRARSLEYVELWSDGMKQAAPRVAEVGERHPELFGAQEVDGVPLREQYARTASTLSVYAEAARLAAVLRRMAADDPLGGSASAVIADHDPGFVIAQLRKWGPRGRQWALDAAREFATEARAHLLEFLAAAAALDADTRDQILDRIEGVIRRDGAAPSAAQCRAAIGL